MGPTIIDPATGGPYSMLNKNKEEKRRKFVAANTLKMEDPLNMQFCYERSRQRLHSIGAQTKLAAQKFNGCSARGWVMLVHIPSARDQERNQGQVVWCLVWHTLKCILPPMPLLLPEEFEYSDTVNIIPRHDGSVQHWLRSNIDKAKSEVLQSINLEREQAKIVYETLRAVTQIPHDDKKSVDENMRSLQRFMFFGEVVADGPNRGKGGLQEATDFISHYGVKTYTAARYRDRGYHPFLLKDTKQKYYCIEESPALDAWVRVSPEEAAKNKKEVALCNNMVPAARLKLLEKDKTAGDESKITFSSAEVAGMERRHYQFGTILDLNEAGTEAFYKATAQDTMLKYTNIIGSSHHPGKDETNRLKNIPTWGAAMRSRQREQENTTLPGGGGHPQKQLWRAGEYDYTRHYSLLKVMLLGAVPVVDAGGANVFATPQVMRTLGPEAGGASRPNLVKKVGNYVEGVRWTPVDGGNWQSFLGGLPPDAEGCVVYLREAGEFVKCKRATGVLNMDCNSTVVTPSSAKEFRVTFTHMGTVMNKRLMYRDPMRPAMGFVPQESDCRTWVPCSDADAQVPPTHDAALTAACTARFQARAARVQEIVATTTSAAVNKFGKADTKTRAAAVNQFVRSFSLSQGGFDALPPALKYIAIKRAQIGGAHIQVALRPPDTYHFKPEVAVTRGLLPALVYYVAVSKFVRRFSLSQAEFDALPPALKKSASLRVQIQGEHGLTYHFKPEVKGRLFQDVSYYVVYRFLREQAAQSLVSRIDDVEYVILCSEQGAYGNILESFIMEELAKKRVGSHQFFLKEHTWPLRKAGGARASKLINYTLPEKVRVRRWGIRNERGEEYDEILDDEILEEDAPAAGSAAAGKRARAAFVDQDSGGAAAGKRPAGDRTRPPGAAFMDLDSGGAASRSAAAGKPQQDAPIDLTSDGDAPIDLTSDNEAPIDLTSDHDAPAAAGTRPQAVFLDAAPAAPAAPAAAPAAPAAAGARAAASPGSDSDSDDDFAKWRIKYEARAAAGRLAREAAARHGAGHGQGGGVGASTTMGACLYCDLSSLDLSRLYL